VGDGNCAAEKALAECWPKGTPTGPWAITTDGGKTHLAPTTLSRWSQAAGADIPNFQAKRIRSGIETLLASVDLSQEHRGRLQSHGISGVQSRHYDGFEYVPQKRAALEMLFKLLEQRPGSNVTPIRQKKRA
jgi:hypothetical protein